MLGTLSFLRRRMLPVAAAAAMLGALAVVGSPTAEAAFVLADPQPEPGGSGGNFCSGSDFNDCSFGGSPAIFKYDIVQEGAGSAVLDQVNTDFASVGTFSIDFDGPASDPYSSGTWSYVAGPNDPGVTAVYYKFGPGGQMYVNTVAAFLGQSLIDVPFSLAKDLSNITLFDTLTPVPLPASAALFAAAVAGLGYLRRRRSGATA